MRSLWARSDHQAPVLRFGASNTTPTPARHGTARQATYGQSGGDKGRAMLDRIVDAAGRDMVTAAYKKRMIMEAERLEEVAA